MKRILTISLLILISSKTNDIEFAKDIPFDNNNNEFEFTYNNTDNFFIRIISNERCRFNLAIDNYPSYGIDVISGETSYITNQDFGHSYKITIESEKNVKGTFWINPSLIEVKINLNSTVEWNSLTLPRENKPKLIYAIDNAEKDATFIFKYFKEGYEDMPNPFEVYHGTDCKDQITTYDFKKGESYKIHVNHMEYNKRLYFPRFSFFDKTKEKKSNSFNLMLNLWNIYLLLLFML